MNRWISVLLVIALLMGCGSAFAITFIKPGSNNMGVDSVSSATSTEPSGGTTYYYYYTPATTSRMYVVNCQEWVSLRAACSSSAPRLAQVPFGAEVTNVETASNGFSLCTYKGITGYIMTQYLSDTPQSAPKDYSTPYKGTIEQPWPDDDFWNMYPNYRSFNGTNYHGGSGTYTVGDYIFSVGSYPYRVVNCNSYVTLREEANAYSDAVLEVPKGETVQVNGELNGWMLCWYNGRYGWIKSGYLKAY